jgi:AcrR family transcriptional regulator
MTESTGEPGQPLSMERVVTAALEQIEVNGAAALTMRNVAKALGATPMSLYRHVRDKAELEALVVDRVLEGVASVRLDGGWREKATALHGELRRVLLERPAAGRLVIDGWARSRGRIRIQDRLYGILQEAGFSGPDVVIAADALELYALGSICHDLADSSRPAGGGSDTGRLAHVGTESTPNLVEYAVYLVKRDADVMFASGYAALVEGLEAVLARTS